MAALNNSDGCRPPQLRNLSFSAISANPATIRIDNSELRNLQTSTALKVLETSYCQGRGRGFEPRRPRRAFQRTYRKGSANRGAVLVETGLCRFTRGIMLPARR